MATQTHPPTKARPVDGRSFRIALVQLGGVGPDKQANLTNARNRIKQAAQGDSNGKPDVIVLPEVFNSPYATKSFRQYAEQINFDPNASRGSYDVATSGCESIQMLSEAAKQEGVWLVGGSIPELSSDDKIYNASPTFSPDGSLVALHRKVHLFDIDIPGGITFKESETLTGGDRLTVIDTEYGKIGVAICYDLRFPEIAMLAARQGCVAMIYPAAFNTTTGPLHWDLLQRARAVDNQMYVIMCSPARGTGENYPAWGYSGVADPMGKLVAQLDEKEGILFADIDMEVINKARSSIPRRFDVYTEVQERSEK
ncbi:Omega-amidase nit3 [Microbotryomycetes sp. JL221]|nr:Omega-amidase nit3 [Microbotryomycetes sp. JL221]